MRIIDADSLIGLVKSSMFLSKGFKHDFISIVNGEPGVEVPEIIRCKDCYYHPACPHEQYLGLDGFCSHAERREETDDKS